MLYLSKELFKSINRTWDFSKWPEGVIPNCLFLCFIFIFCVDRVVYRHCIAADIEADIII